MRTSFFYLTILLVTALIVFNCVDSAGLSADLDNYTEKDIILIASAINAVAKDEPYAGQVAVGAVILNRVNHASFPNTIAGVVLQEREFEASDLSQPPSESSLKAAKDALNGWDPSNGAVYYWNPKKVKNKWVLSIPVTIVIGSYHFGIG